MFKRLVLSNLREVLREFEEIFPDCKVGFSKFAELRPKNCFSRSEWYNTQCVCTIHLNVKLMSFEMQITELPTYHHCLAKIMCNPPHARCYLGECDVRPGTEVLKEELLTHFDKSGVEQVIYK